MIVNGQYRSYAVLKRMKRRRIITSFFVSIVVILLIYCNFFDKYATLLKFYYSAAQANISCVVSNAAKNFSRFNYLICGDFEKDFLKVQNENAGLRLEIAKLKILREENQSLLSILSIKDKSLPASVVNANVLTIFSNDYVRSCIIDIGADDNVSVDDSVIHKNGVVGRIVEVDRTWSKVLLITDINSNVPIKIGDINAIASGTNGNELKITTVYCDLNLVENAMAVTSGYGGVFLENTIVGKVFKSDNDFLISPSVNFNALKHVVVLKKKI